MVISFLPAPPCEDQGQVENKAVDMKETPDQQNKDTLPEEYPKFGERPDTGKAYDFKKE